MDMEERARQERWKAEHGMLAEDEETHSLQEWFEEMYFETEQKTNMDQEEISHIGALIQRMLRLEPAARPSAQELLQDSWFRER